VPDRATEPLAARVKDDVYSKVAEPEKAAEPLAAST
jgi:hypothetical protein